MSSLSSSSSSSSASASASASASSSAAASGSRGRLAGGGPRALTARVTAARFVASWRWTVAEADEVCGICRSAFEACCPSCRFAGDECPPLVGACKHAYHLHCINAWLTAKDKEQVCPLCRRPWE